MHNAAKDTILAEEFHVFIEDETFPCVGAKAALSRGQIDFAFARDIRSNWDDTVLARELRNFAQTYSAAPSLFRSFVILFHARDVLPEAEFEHHLWRRLQSFSDKDTFHGAPTDPRVAADPADTNFGLSLGGEAFFVVGLHPGASRPARHFSRAALVFNAHEQFTQLRAQDKYERMRETIIERDVKLAGSSNPMLARHGEKSEARQYSGRIVGKDWECPYERRGSDEQGRLDGRHAE